MVERPPLAHAQSLTLNLVGTPGSKVVSYEATGSVVTTVGISAASDSTAGLLPGNGGTWLFSPDNDLGDILSNFDPNDNDNLLLSGGGISYRANGVEFGVLGQIDLDPSTTAGGDDIELQPTPPVEIDYPAITAGTTVSWTGSGTFTLDSPAPFANFEDVFTTGTFSNTIDGGFYTVNVSVIPEPSQILGTLAAIGLGGVFWWKRRK